MNKNRYIIFLCFTVLSIGICTAQVGINTKSPVNIFNIDVLGNNPLVNPQSSNNLKDDLIFRLNANSEANLVIGGETLSSVGRASLELNDPNKALLLNRVSLQSASDITTIASPRDGMIVYNTSTNGAGEDVITPGTYLNMHQTWSRFIDNVSAGGAGSKIGELSANTTSGQLSDIGAGTGAVAFNVAGGDIIIPEDGRYIFNFRLYGGITTGTIYREYYLYLFKSSDGVETFLDSLYMVVVKASNSSFATYTPVIVTPYLEAGDTIIIRLGHPSTSSSWTLVSNPRTMANRTSFVYWKLQ